MKLTCFHVSIAVAKDNGYDNCIVAVASENTKLTFNYPYGDIPSEVTLAISEFSKTITDAYNVLQSQIRGINKDLQLEEYAPQTDLNVETNDEGVANNGTDLTEVRHE